MPFRDDVIESIPTSAVAAPSEACTDFTVWCISISR